MSFKITLDILASPVYVRSMNNIYDNDDFPLPPANLISTCCGVPSMTELYETDKGNLVGICSTCKEYTTFEPELENER